MSIGGINGHDFEPDPCGQSVCRHCGLLGWTKHTTCVVGLPRCESCKKPKAQSSADVDSGRYCCKGFGTSESCAPYGLDPLADPMRYGSTPRSAPGPIAVAWQAGQYAAPAISQRDIDAELGALVRKDLDTFTSAELYHAVRELRAKNHRLAPVMTNIFAAYRAAKGKMQP